MATQVKYQIFISSTFEDLRAERDQVIRAVLEMGHIPVGMEMFSAADEEQWRIIQRHIDESDYYVVIIAHRYGSVTDEGISYTRKEYEYAREVGVPTLGFILDQSASWSPKYVDRDDATRELLDDFRALVREKPVSEWRSASDLYGKCSVALMKAFTGSPRQGWIRATESLGPEVTAELSRLSAENSRLRLQLDDAMSMTESEKLRELQHLRATLLRNTLELSYRRTRRDEWRAAGSRTMWHLFSLVAPDLLVEASVEATAHWLAMNIGDDEEGPTDIVPLNQIKGLFGDFMALGVVEPSKKKHSVSDTGEYWTLTEIGRSLFHYVRRVELEGAGRDTPIAREGGATTPVKKRTPRKRAAPKRA
jgi:hypothetical protein